MKFNQKSVEKIFTRFIQIYNFIMQLVRKKDHVSQFNDNSFSKDFGSDSFNHHKNHDTYFG